MQCGITLENKTEEDELLPFVEGHLAEFRDRSQSVVTIASPESVPLGCPVPSQGGVVKSNRPIFDIIGLLIVVDK